MNGNRFQARWGVLAGLLLPLFLAGCPSGGSSTDDTPPADPVTGDNNPPVIGGTPPAVVKVGVNYSFSPQASDEDGDALTFSIVNQPAWLDFDTGTGALDGVPPDGSAGSYNDIEISVSDGELTDTLGPFTITVEPAESGNMPPEISGNPSTSVETGDSYSFTPDASDPDGDPLTFSVQNRPDWADFDAATGRLSGVPQAGDEGTYAAIAITVSDGTATASLPDFSITVGTGEEPVTHIPDIPFDYAREPGTATRSGTLPSSLGAGEVLALDDYSENGDLAFSCSGTEANPAFIVGGALHNDGQVLQIDGSWCIFVGTVFDNVLPRTSGDHMIFRGVEVTDHDSKNCMDLGGSNIVLVDSEIHHCQGDDRHGIQVSRGAENVWVLRNHVHHNGGDGIQACHQCSDDPPRNVYIGDNLFHSDRENGIDFKYIENVIVEGNTVHSYVSSEPGVEWCFDDGSGCDVFSSGSDGAAIAIGTDGGPTNVRVINNHVYDSVKAIRIEEGVQINIEDNHLHDVEWCLQLEKNGYNTIFTENTCENALRGIFQNWRDQFSLTVDGNTFRNLSDPAIEYEQNAVFEASTLTGNLFSNTGPVIYGNTVATTEAAINALPGAQDNVVE